MSIVATSNRHENCALFILYAAFEYCFYLSHAISYHATD